MLIGKNCQNIEAAFTEVFARTVQKQSILMLASVLELFVSYSLLCHKLSDVFIRGLVEVELNAAILMER